MTCCITRPVLDKALHLGELSGLTEIDFFFFFKFFFPRWKSEGPGALGRMSPADGSVFSHLPLLHVAWGVRNPLAP